MVPFFYWSILLFVSLVVVAVIFFAFPQILLFIDNRMDSLRDFTKKNDSFFSLFFIGLFGIEQAILIILLFVFGDNLSLTKLIVSIFALFVITTATLQKSLLETKRRYEREVRVSLEGSNRVISRLRATNGYLMERIRRLEGGLRKRL